MEPHKKSEPPMGLVTAEQLKADIFANIEMIFNSRRRITAENFFGCVEVENSVLGFGITDFCGKTKSEDYREEMRQHILKMLRLFEPRLEPSSITVNFSQEKDGSILEFAIGGVIRLIEVNEEVLFLSSLDLESGNASLSIEEG